MKLEVVCTVKILFSGRKVLMIKLGRLRRRWMDNSKTDF
jgi:hypothetical protein